ncbi:histone-fold-containing protein [Tuber indicum]|nr:histone-fold-containing protein [Tuber indicum]
MSASPSKDLEGEVGVQSPDEQEHMDQPETSQQQPAFDFEVKEQDRWLPIANVARIMKTALPENAKIAKEAKESSEKCQQEKRKTVNGEDILFAMTSLGFENYAEALKIYLAKYRESQSQRNQSEGARGGSGGYGGGGNAPPPPGYRRPEGPNATVTSPIEGEEHQAGYNDVYGHVAGNGDGPY